MSAKINRH